jgi:hypothetical protein
MQLQVQLFFTVNIPRIFAALNFRDQSTSERVFDHNERLSTTFSVTAKYLQRLGAEEFYY